MNNPKNENLYTLEKAIQDINDIMNILDLVRDKYDYIKLPYEL